MIITIDTGGTKTLIGRFTDDGTLRDNVRFATPKDVAEYINFVSSHVSEIAGQEVITDISIGLPGVIKDGTAVYCINLGWENVPIRDLLLERFPGARVLIENDANLAGLASMRRIEPRPCCGLYVSIGTGIGTSIILNGELHDGLKDCEGGHMQVTYRSKTDSWENIASGRAINEQFGERAEDLPAEAWPEVAERLAVGLQTLVAALQPKIIVIGGGIGRYTNMFAPALSGLISESLPSFITCPPIIGAPYPEEAVLYGCYDNCIINR